METLTPIAQICITLIEGGLLRKEDAPLLVKEEVLNFYKNKEKEGEDIDV